MAITRTPLVDDDGTGTTGTILNNAWKQEFYDQIDAFGSNAASLTSGTLPVARLGAGTTTYRTSASTGTQNAWSPGLSGNTFVEWGAASDMTLNGMPGGVAGQCVFVRSNGTGVIYVMHNNGGAAAGTRFSNPFSGALPIAQGGYAIWVFNGTSWLLIGHDQGAWIPVPLAAGNFVSDGGAWTISSQTYNAYRVSGRALMWSVVVAGNLAATANVLSLILPGISGAGTYPCAPYSGVCRGLAYCAAGGGYLEHWGHINGAGGALQIDRPGAQWLAGAMNINISTVATISG